MPKQWKLILLTAVFVLAMPVPILAGEDEHEEHRYRHQLELFLGGAFEDGEEGFSVGVSYEHRLTEHIGIGGLWKWAGGDFDKWIAVFPLYIHPYKGIRFNVGPGLEHKNGEEEFLFRIGLGYEFEFGRHTITPEINVDTVDGEQAVILGINFGYLF